MLLLSGQLAGPVAEAEHQNPNGHVTATDTPGAQYDPDGQETATPFRQNDPAAHVAGSDEPGAHTAPAGQAVGLAAPAEQKY